MKIGIIGGGSVGQTIGAKLAANGHDVVLGIRSVTPEELAKPRQMAKALSEWKAETRAKVATMREAALHGEIIFNATQGSGALEALGLAGADALGSKTLIDISNPLDFSHGMPPAILPAFAGATSLGEEIQKAFPKARVVKAFNTIAAAVMVNPGAIPGDHDLLITGEDSRAKAEVEHLAKHEFGWKSVLDLGGIKSARGTEHLLPLWVILWGVTGTPMFNVKVVR
jgi:8-hydroxy-5-deazaflavin:NADPH oxidoreductase